MEIVIALAVSLLLIIILLIMFGVYQIKLSGMEIRDFWSFIKAHEKLMKLTKFSKKYQTLSKEDQILFLSEAQTVFDAFEKVPTKLWEEEYTKYYELLDRYQKEKTKEWKQTEVKSGQEILNLRLKKYKLNTKKGNINIKTLKILVKIAKITFMMNILVQIIKQISNSKS